MYICIFYVSVYMFNFRLYGSVVCVVWLGNFVINFRGFDFRFYKI